MKIQVRATVSADIVRILDMVSIEHGVSKSVLIERALDRYLDRFTKGQQGDNDNGAITKLRNT